MTKGDYKPMRIMIYIVDVIILLAILFGSLMIAALLADLIAPQLLNAPTGSYSSAYRVLAIFWFAGAWTITKICHNRIKEYLEEHSIKETSISILQLFVVGFMALFGIIRIIVNILFPIAVIYIAYHFWMH